MGESVIGRPLEGKAVLVSGGGKGIGRAICLRLAAMGASIALTARDDMASAEAVAIESAALGVDARAISMNLASRVSVEDAVAATAAAFGRLDILVSNAGASRRGRLVDLSSDDWDYLFTIQTRGFFYLATAAARAMIAQGEGGAIIAIAGASALRSYPGNGAYGPSKAAVLSTVRQLALECAEHGLRVNAVLPGPIRETGEDWRNNEPNLVRQTARIPLQRPGTPAEVADAVAYLATADYVTGQDLVVDGGSTTTWYLTT